MIHCVRCHTRSGGDAVFCAACGAALQEDAPGRMVEDHASPAAVRTVSLSIAGSGEAPAGRPRPLFYVIGSALVLFGLFVFGLDGTLDRPLVASAMVDARSSEARYTEIRAAADVLERLLVKLEQHLDQRAAMDPSTRAQWLAAWEAELQAAKGHYQLWGNLDATRSDARAEDAIRNALLYLVSLERLAARDDAGRTAEYEELRSSFASSLATARQP